MDAAITAFLVTVAIVGGILSPVILIAIIGTVGNAMKALAAALEAKVEEIKKQPPFDDVEANLDPATKILSVRFIKDGNVLWQGSATRNEQEAYPTINFYKDKK